MRSTLKILPDDHVYGPEHAPVTLLEYGDYECPHCGRAHPIVKALQESLGDNLRYVFRHFPLRTAHPHSENAHESAEAAGTMGKYWEMHDLLFTNQDRLEDEDLLEYGAQVGLEPEALAVDLATHRFYPRVQRDLISGMRSGVNGTPTFFINGVRHNDDYEFTTLLNAISAAAQAPAG